MTYLVSACLLGIACRYDGASAHSPRVQSFLEGKSFIPVCPEQLGGLPTPRVPCELQANRVVDQIGKDRTEAFHRGAEETLAIARMTGCTAAILQRRSPSCGVRHIYDGTFTGTLVPGMGVTAMRLQSEGISILTEDDLE